MGGCFFGAKRRNTTHQKIRDRWSTGLRWLPGNLTTNQTVVSVTREALESRYDQGGMCGEDVATKKIKIERVTGLGFRWLTLDKRRQQPTESQPWQ